MANPNDDKSHLIEVLCSCGTKLNMPAAAVGRRARCPKCKEVFMVPEPPADNGAEGADLESEEQFSLVEELAEEPSMVIAGPAPGEAGRTDICSQCGKRLGAGASLCVHCGYNNKTRHQHKGASALRSILGGLLRRTAAGAGTYVLGCILSSLGALIGAAVWCIVAVVTDFEIGWIAWGLGILAGIGMSIGYESKNVRAGVTAACIAVVGIGCGKLMVFVYVNYPEIQQARQDINSFGDEDSFKRMRIAAHHADREADQQGLSHENARRERLHDQHYEKIEDLSPAELDQALAEIEAWDEGGKWEDPDYARNFLIYSQADQEVDEYYAQFNESGEEEYTELPASQWRKMYQNAIASVDSLSPEQQLQRAQEVEREQERESERLRLAWHHTELRTMEMGLSQVDKKRSEITKAEIERLKELSDQELDALISKLEEWEDRAKWDDLSYARNYLIYARVNEAMESWYEDHQEYSDEYNSQFELEWKSRYQEVVAEVDTLAQSRCVELARRSEQQQQQKAEAFYDEVQAEMTRDLASDAMTFFFENSFGVFDLLWVFFAIGSAFKIASGGAMED